MAQLKDLIVNGASRLIGNVITGNLLPGANNNYTLGSATSTWKEIFISSQDGAMNNGLQFTDGTDIKARVGSNQDGKIGIYGATDVIIRPSLTSSGVGIVLNGTSVVPGANNNHTLGSSSLKWNNVYATTFTGALSGNAATATKLATARTISLTGSVTGSGSFDGSGNLSIATTTNHNHKTLTIGNKTYNGSSDTTIEIADLGLASTTTFLGITSTNLSNESTTSPITITIGPTTGSVTPSNGSVVMEADTGEEFIWTGNKWNSMGLASSWALANHIHGNILNNGTITSDTAKASGQHLVITDSNNKICRSALKLGTSSTTYLCNNGTWATPVGDHKVSQLAAITSAGAYPVILACSTATTAQTAGVNKTTTLTYNPSTTKLHTPIVEVTNASYGGTLPSSGTTGQLFFQTTSDYYEIPTGGTTGQALIKNSNSDRDIKWGTIEPGGVMTPNSSAKYYVTGSTLTTQNSNPAVFNTAIYVDGGVLYGAAWNDYAEFRQINNKVECGRCVVENGDDTMSLSAARLQPGAEIISDTYGFVIGAQKEKSQPVATSGRVLAYPYESRKEFKNNIGKPVCSGPNGTVSIMTDEEYQKYGYLAIGTISAIPEYEYWGENNVKVDNRVWIRVK